MVQVKNESMLRISAYLIGHLIGHRGRNLTQGECYDFRKRPETTVHNDENGCLRLDYDRKLTVKQRFHIRRITIVSRL